GDLAIREAAVRVDRGVDVVVSDTRLGVVYDVATAMHAPAAARWDTTEFLDVDVDELAGMVCVDPANHAPGRPVHPRKSVQAMATQDPMHRRRRHSNNAGNASWSKLATLTQRHDPLLHTNRGLVRASVRRAGSVLESGVAIGQ